MIQYIHQYGDQVALQSILNCDHLLQELSQFDDEWSQYNVLKPTIRRQGLCVLNERGNVGPGPALNSLREWNKKYNTTFSESDFNKPTEVYNNSLQLQSILGEILPYCVRTHFLRLGPGGFFPPHRDHIGKEQSTFRLIVPIKAFNPPDARFMIEDRSLYWEEGRMYAVNTTKEHTLFNASNQDSIWLVINAKVCDETIRFVSKNLKSR